jgi:uncharacterized SAM-binding protein YcdF (DUF218 family)
VLDFLKQTLRPAQISCVLALLTPGVVSLFVPPLKRWGRRWLAMVALFYWALSTPAGTGLLVRTLRGPYQPLTSADQARGARVVVLLGSGSMNLRASGRQLSAVTGGAGLRVLEAARLFDLLGGPLIIASGGVTEHDPEAAPESIALQRALVSVGVPNERILPESQSKNTHDEAVIIKRMLAERGVTTFILVTSPMHMTRSLRTFEHEGMHPIPSPSQLVPDQAVPDPPFMPNDMWLEIGDLAIYEWLARGYYWWRGWLSPVKG